MQPGLALALFVVVPLVLIAVISGLVGLYAGVAYKDWIGIAAAILGLTLIGLGVLGLSDAMNF